MLPGFDLYICSVYLFLWHQELLPVTFTLTSCDVQVQTFPIRSVQSIWAGGWGEGAGCLLEAARSASVLVPYRIPRVPRCVLLLPLPAPYGHRVRTINPLQAALSLVELLAVFLAFTLVNW